MTKSIAIDVIEHALSRGRTPAEAASQASLIEAAGGAAMVERNQELIAALGDAMVEWGLDTPVDFSTAAFTCLYLGALACQYAGVPLDALQAQLPDAWALALSAKESVDGRTR